MEIIDQLEYAYEGVDVLRNLASIANDSLELQSQLLSYAYAYESLADLTRNTNDAEERELYLIALEAATQAVQKALINALFDGE